MPSERKFVYPELIQQYGDKCFYCKVELTAKTRTVDHIIPMSRFNGEKYDTSNLVLSCLFCNSQKATMEQKEYIEFINKPIMECLTLEYASTFFLQRSQQSESAIKCRLSWAERTIQDLAKED